MCFICKYSTQLHKGLEHPRILVSVGVLGPVSCGYQGTTVCTYICVLIHIYHTFSICILFMKQLKYHEAFKEHF